MDFGSSRNRSSQHSPVIEFFRRGLIVPLAFAVLSLGAYAQDNPPAPPADDTQGQDTQSQNSQQQNTADTGTVPTPAASGVRAVRLSDVEGSVQIFNGDSQAFSQAQPNMPVVEGMRIITAGDGRAEMQFEDGSVARVAPNSSITLTELGQMGSNTETVIDATSGLTYYELNGQAGEYSVRFANYMAVPNDSAVLRIDLDASPAELSVMQGGAHVTDAQNLALDVTANHSVRLDGLGRYQLADAVSSNTWDQWNTDRDAALATLDQSATAGRADTGNPNDPAWNDLDYYGDWYNVPGYGMAWAPSGVDAGFDPYGQGAWGYYPTLGYTWISSYPWGWLPYHCGAWNWFDGNGWMWLPGNCGALGYAGGWYAYSTIWRVPPGYRPPHRPQPPLRHHPPHVPGSNSAQGSNAALIAVNRGGDSGQQFRSLGGARPAARVFSYQGTDLHPASPVLHPEHPGPLGESFSRDVVRERPAMPRPEAPVGSFSGGATGVHSTMVPSRNAISLIEPRGSYVPPRGSVSPAPPRFAVPPTVRPAPAPHYAPPPPAPHFAAPSGSRSH